MGEPRIDLLRGCSGKIHMETSPLKINSQWAVDFALLYPRGHVVGTAKQRQGVEKSKAPPEHVKPCHK
jgi:hypothetical protein